MCVLADGGGSAPRGIATAPKDGADPHAAFEWYYLCNGKSAPVKMCIKVNEMRKNCQKTRLQNVTSSTV